MTRGGKRNGAGRPKQEVTKKMYSFRLSEEELKAVREILDKMRNKLILLFCLFTLSLPCFALTLEGGVSYTEETARQEAFKDVLKINGNAIYLTGDERYKFDIHTTKGIKAVGVSKIKIFGVIPFNTYQVCYDDEPDTEYLYEKKNGEYRLFATINISERNKPYPQRFIKYDNYGHLMSIEFNSGYESFIFDKDGKLVAKWQGGKGKTIDNKVNIKSEIKYSAQ